MAAPDRALSAARRRILDSALLELSARGPRLSYDALAERAGVNKTTLYRNWPDPAELIVEALDAESEEPAIRLKGGSRERLRLLAHDAKEKLSPRERRIIVVVIAAAQNDDRIAQAFHRYWDRRFHVAGDDAEAAQILAAQTLFHTLVLGRELTNEDIDRWVTIAMQTSPQSQRTTD